MWPYHRRIYDRVKSLKDADGMANSVDPDQNAQEQSDLRLHCLHRPVCPENFGSVRYIIIIIIIY